MAKTPCLNLNEKPVEREVGNHESHDRNSEGYAVDECRVFNDSELQPT
jgi:hypothetical protein